MSHLVIIELGKMRTRERERDLILRNGTVITLFRLVYTAPQRAKKTIVVQLVHFDTSGFDFHLKTNK